MRAGRLEGERLLDQGGNREDASQSAGEAAGEAPLSALLDPNSDQRPPLLKTQYLNLTLTLSLYLLAFILTRLSPSWRVILASKHRISHLLVSATLHPLAVNPLMIIPRHHPAHDTPSPSRGHGRYGGISA